MPSERFVVIGLGRYGSRLAVNLARAGAEVIAIDRNREVVEEIRDRVTLAVAMDSTDEQALRLQGVDKVGVAVVAIGHDFEANALTTVILKHIGVKRVISRAGNPMQVRILSRIGADSVVNPEDETADRWSHKLLAPYLIDHIELAAGYGLVQIPTPRLWVNKTLAELEIRRTYSVNIVAIKRRVLTSTETGQEEYDEMVMDTPMPTSRLNGDDILIIAGRDEDLEDLPQ
ncbi:MAG: TrkA family potassium uptake protein [Phycisphaerales bacterium]|nr:TrkA family potassium uptake protein [Phycisphaerales bacterium]